MDLGRSTLTPIREEKDLDELRKLRTVRYNCNYLSIAYFFQLKDKCAKIPIFQNTQDKHEVMNCDSRTVKVEFLYFDVYTCKAD